jgi:hypothetical protein
LLGGSSHEQPNTWWIFTCSGANFRTSSLFCYSIVSFLFLVRNVGVEVAMVVRVSDHLWVLDPTSVGSGSFFHPRVEPTPEKTWNPKNYEKNSKKSKTRKKLKKNKKHKIKNPETNTFTKHDGHPNLTRNSQVYIRLPDFTCMCGFRCQIQLDYIFSRVEFLINPTWIWPIAIYKKKHCPLKESI